KVRARRREKIPCTSAEVLPEVAEMDNEAPICPDPHHAVDTLLSRAPEVLDERELWIVKSRFGLGPSDAGAKTLREIAADLGVSKERVRQLQLKAMEKLKTLLDPTEFNLDGVAA
ncbi:MAG: sigma factor-like helix-turn-helix DNA-binding protein, partial [Planctomycetaceae bacterium]